MTVEVPRYPKAVILDTNVLLPIHARTSHPQFRELLTVASRSAVDILVPQVVVEELIENQVQRLQKSARAAFHAVKTLSEYDIEAQVVPDELRNQDFKKCVRLAIVRRLDEADIRRLPLPKPSIEELVDRAVSCQPPFEANDKGFRDELILQSVIEAADRYTNGIKGRR